MRRFAVLVAAFVGLAMAVGAAPAAADPVANEQQFVVLINQLRASKGLGAVSPDGELLAVARAWSAVMARTQTLAHNPSFPNQVHSDWLMLGENVGVGPTVDELHRAFVASPAHYKNLVEPRFDAVGIGIVELNGTIWVTQNFKQRGAAPAPAKATPAPAPKPTPRPAAAPRAPAPAPQAAAPAPPAPTTTVAPAPPAPPSPALAPVGAAPAADGQAAAPDADVQGVVFDRIGRHSKVLLGLGGTSALVVLAFAVVLLRRRRRRSSSGMRI